MPTAIFDMLGTFFSLEPLRQRLTALGAPEHALEFWFAESLRDYFALSHSDRYLPLSEVLAASLPRTLAILGKGSQDPSRHELVLKGLKVLNPAEGAAEACERLTAAGFKLVALTNGGEEHTRALLERAGLMDKFAAVLSADAAGRSKPHADVYALARHEIEGDAWMISAHGWDILGAHQAGLRTAWISRKEKQFLSVFPTPDVEAPHLAACASQLTEAATASEPIAPVTA